MGAVEDKLILEVTDKFGAILNATTDKFKEVLVEVSQTRNVVNEMLYDDLVELKVSVKQLNTDVGSMTNSVKKLVEVADALTKKVEDTEKIKNKGKVYILAGKIIIGIAGSIMASFLFLKDNFYDLGIWIKGLLK